MKIVELKPIKETTKDYEKLERLIKDAFRRYIYLPILKHFEIPHKKLKNARSLLIEEMNRGRITYSRGAFRGKFNSETSKELLKLGAKWDQKTGVFKIPAIQLPMEMKEAIRISELRFSGKILRLEKELEKLDPSEIASSINMVDFFDKALFDIEKKTNKTIREMAHSRDLTKKEKEIFAKRYALAITVEPKLTDPQREKIAEDYQYNMELYIKKFLEEEIVELRETVQKSAYAGNRYESLIKGIKESYGVSSNKAKFLARQETNLLLVKYKEVRYTAAGVNKYRWACVKMPHDKTPEQHTPGNVRYYHGILEGQIFSWDDPPYTNRNPDRRNNAGADYNCRCYSIPLISFDNIDNED